MLKLQRASSHKDIAVRFRGTEPFFNRHFLRALFIALVLHVGGISLVGVTPMKVRSLLHYATVMTEVDMGSSTDDRGAIATLNVDEQGLLPRHVLEPEAPIPRLPDMPWVRVSLHTEHLKGVAHPGSSFAQVESIPYVTPLKSLPFIHIGPPVEIRVGRSLPIQKDSLKALNRSVRQIQRYDSMGKHTVLLEIRIDDRTGEVFWAAVNRSSGVEKLDKYALDLVKAVLFERNNTSFVTDGEVEVAFNFSEENMNVEQQVVHVLGIPAD